MQTRVAANFLRLFLRPPMGPPSDLNRPDPRGGSQLWGGDGVREAPEDCSFDLGKCQKSHYRRPYPGQWLLYALEVRWSELGPDWFHGGQPFMTLSCGVRRASLVVL